MAPTWVPLNYLERAMSGLALGDAGAGLPFPNVLTSTSSLPEDEKLKPLEMR